MENDFERTYGNKLRIRVCGLCWQNGNLLMVRHAMPSSNFWAPPGGGLEYGQATGDALRREFREETGLEIEPGVFRFGCELIRDPLHAVELFFDVSVKGGTLQTGSDPELQIIREVKFLSGPEIFRLQQTERHGIFDRIRNLHDLTTLHGFFRI